MLDQPIDLATGTGGDIVLDPAVAVPRRPDGDRIRPLASTTPEPHAASPVFWHRAANAVFASVLVPPGQVRGRLIVEPLPRQNGWDWAVWRPGNDPQQSRYGRASSVVSAMAAAEDAAVHWVKTGSPGD